MFQKEVDTILPAVLDAGATLLKFFKEKNYTVHEKSANNPVTEADFAANKILIEAIQANFPDDAILSEEVSDGHSRSEMNQSRQGNARVWVIDPLDGTKEFVAGIPHFSVSVGLLVDSQPVLGFIHNPASQFTIHGGKDTPVTCNREIIKPRQYQPKDLSEMNICLSRSEFKKGLFSDLLKTVTLKESQVIGSVAYKLGLVAAGKFDLILSKKPKNEWDIAGGAGIFSALQYALLDEKSQEIAFNKEDTRSYGLIGGSPEAIKTYHKFLGTI